MPLLLIYSLHLNYVNITWCSINRAYLKTSQQKHAIRIVFHEKKFTHTRKHFKENNTLNFYQLNVFNNLFLHRFKNVNAPNVFLYKSLRPLHHYPTSSF